MIQIYGIKNCDTIKKTLAWFNKEGVEFVFNDYKKVAPSAELIKRWLASVDWESLLNKRGTTWRKLPDSDKESLTRNGAIDLMVANPSLIKRPVITGGDIVIVGYDEDAFVRLTSRQS